MASAKSRRVVCACLSALLIAAQLAAFSHLALVEHRICVLHGKPIHVKHATSPAVPSWTLAPMVQSTRGIADHAHDHCKCPASARERFVLAALGHDGAHSCAPTVSLGVPVANTPLRSIAILALAPKSSPPV